MTDPATLLGVALLACLITAMAVRHLMDRRRPEPDDIDWLADYRKENP